jgi:NTP pyrophosphatase (non-canonical NTP hydrolase)
MSQALNNNMTTRINLEELIPRVHDAARAKGFWDAEPSAKRFLMLTVSELGECLEADRKNVYADLALYDVCIEKVHHLNESLWLEGEARAFKECIKDTVEDELADTYIRICDIVAGFSIGTSRVIRSRNSWHPMLADDLAGCLFEITQLLVNLSSGGFISTLNTGEALAYLEHLAERAGIDLPRHIELKLAYNLSRPTLHGKAY